MGSRKVILLVVLLLVLAFVAADTPGPEVAAKRAFDKSAADAKAAYERALGTAYKGYYAKVLTPLVAANKTKAADRQQELETAVNDVKKVLTDAGAEVPEMPVSEGAFMGVIGNRCAKCHSPCKTIDSMKAHGYIQPGKPETSVMYTACNNGRPAHKISDEEQAIIYEFIRQMKK